MVIKTLLVVKGPKVSGAVTRTGMAGMLAVAFGHSRTVSPFSVIVVGAGVAGIVAAAVWAAESFAFTSNRPSVFPELIVTE